MMDVTIQPFATNMWFAAMGVIKYNQAMQVKSQYQISQLNESKRQVDAWESTLNQMTETIIDKRFNSSKAFMQTHEMTDNLRFKKSLSESDISLYQSLKKQTLKAKTQYDMQMNSYNKFVQNKNNQAQLKNFLKVG